MYFCAQCPLLLLIFFLFSLQERHENLEKMGVSVQTSGIKVEKGKCFLVNLNADPSLNEMLVYYLKVRLIPGKIMGNWIYNYNYNNYDLSCPTHHQVL